MTPGCEKCRNREYAAARQQQYQAAEPRLSFWFRVFLDQDLLPLRLMVTMRQVSAYVLRN
jgi:hypothetical protein